jgi:hypothetical protein
MIGSRLGAPARHPVGVDDLPMPVLPLRQQVQMILQLPEHLPALDLQPRLQFGMRQPGRTLPLQPGHHLLETTTRSGKRGR